MAAAEVDVTYVSTHLGLSESTISSALEGPTVDLVKSILQAIAAKAYEYNELYSEKLQLDIELETTARGAEAQCAAFKASADKALKDLEEVRRKLQDEGMQRLSLVSMIQRVFDLSADNMQNQLGKASSERCKSFDPRRRILPRRSRP